MAELDADREIDRWVVVADLGVVMGDPQDLECQRDFLAAALQRFNDVPEQEPGFDDVLAYAGWAVKRLLSGLIDRADDQQIARETPAAQILDDFLKRSP
jgi:hypothetical protein